MSNVKPGDLAVVTASIYPPEFSGVLCLVKGPFRGVSEREQLWRETAVKVYGCGPIWEVEVLQPVWFKHMLFKSKNPIKAGDLCHIFDQYLRRVEPPADATDVFSQQPLEGELNGTVLNNRL